MTHAKFPPGESSGLSRRELLRHGAMLSAAGASPFVVNLAAMGAAAAQTASDYKALVVIFLNGGNDHANTIVPYDTVTWGAYNKLRPNLAYTRDRLAATALSPKAPLADGVQYALAPELASLLPLFSGGALTTLLNVGTLVEPTTRAQYLAKSVKLPPKLGSHNDQRSYWQSEQPEGATSGWGGRIGDLFASSNSNATFTCIGTGGNATFLSGMRTSQFQIASSGSVPVNAIKSNNLAGSAACAAALRATMTGTRVHLLENEYARVCTRSIESNTIVSTALAGAVVKTVFPTSLLGAQLSVIAKMIAARSALGAKRQVFLASLGDFDTHANLLATHPLLLKDLGDSLAAFYAATVELGVSRQVTSFTASEFGRTILSNSSGSDHGWGSSHLVIGGAVNGKSFVGKSPVYANNGPDDIGQGRLIPTTSVDQLAATLANWFGVSASDQLALLPNLSNFSTRNLGFMSA